MLDIVQCTTGNHSIIHSWESRKRRQLLPRTILAKTWWLAPHAAALQKLLQGLEGGAVPLTSFCPNPRLLHLWVQHFLPSWAQRKKALVVFASSCTSHYSQQESERCRIPKAVVSVVWTSSSKLGLRGLMS